MNVHIYIYIYEKKMYVFIDSPGPRPNGVSGSFLDGAMVKGSLFQMIQGTPPAQTLHAIEYLEQLFRLFGAQRLDLFDLLAYREGVQK